MEKNDLMKQYEAERGRIMPCGMEIPGGFIYSKEYVSWLEVRMEEILRVLNAVCVLFDNGERRITVGERANLMIAKALIEKYPKEWTE